MCYSGFKALHSGTPETTFLWSTLVFLTTSLSHGGLAVGVLLASANTGTRPALSHTSLGHPTRLPHPPRVAFSLTVSVLADWSSSGSSEIPIGLNFTVEEGNVGIFAENLPQEPISKTPSACQGVLAGTVNMLARNLSSCSPPLKGNGFYILYRGQRSFLGTIRLHEVTATFKFHSLEMFQFCLIRYPVALTRSQEEPLTLWVSIFLLWLVPEPSAWVFVQVLGLVSSPGSSE